MLGPGEHTFSANGLELWYKVSGSGPLCVMPTPGWGASSDIHFLTMGRLEEFLTMVYLDTRGTGRSERPPALTDYTYELFAADLEALREHLGQEQILILGHSQGSMHAMQYALRHPEGCRGLVLIDGLPAFDEHLDQDTQRNIMARQDEPWFEKAFAALSSQEELPSDEAFGQHLMTIVPFYFVDQTAIDRYAAAFAATTFSVEASRGQEAVQLDLNLLPELHRITAPTLLVVGSDDFICSPLQSERIHLRIANSKLIVIQQAGHFPWLEQPEQFFPRVKSGMEALGLLESTA